MGGRLAGGGGEPVGHEVEGPNGLGEETGGEVERVDYSEHLEEPGRRVAALFRSRLSTAIVSALPTNPTTQRTMTR